MLLPQQSADVESVNVFNKSRSFIGGFGKRGRFSARDRVKR